MKTPTTSQSKGFTLIEILIVIAIIGILALVVFVALNPAGRFADSRNSTRTQNVESLGKAILHYNVDNGGLFPTGMPMLKSSTYASGFDGSGIPQCTFASVTATPDTSATGPGCEWADSANLTTALVPKYMTAVPTDSANVSNHYFVALTPDGQHLVVMVQQLEKGANSNPTGSTTPYYQSF